MNFSKSTIAELFSISDPVWDESVNADGLFVIRLSGVLANYRADAASLQAGTIEAVDGQQVTVFIGTKTREPGSDESTVARDRARRRCLRGLAFNALVYAAAMTPIKVGDALRVVAADSVVAAHKPLGPIPQE